MRLGRNRLRRGLWRCAAVLLGLVILPIPAAQAEPVRIESENIVFYGDVRPEFAEDFVRQMEIYRRMIFALAGKEGAPPDTQKLTIHGFYTTRDVQKFAGRDDIAGIYTQSQDGPVFLTPTKRRKGGSDWANQVALHEYSHHVLGAIVRDTFPLWYNEGFANYLSTLQIADDRITIGAPNVRHAESFVHRIGWLPPALVLGAVDRYPEFSGSAASRAAATNQFYAQSWLYVHLMQSTPELGRKLPDYIAALGRGVRPAKAFEDAFGLSVQAFHERAERYWDANAFEVVAFEPQGRFLDVALSTTPISKSELARAQIAGQLVFLNDANRNDFARRVERAAREHPGDPVVTEALASIHIAAEAYDNAFAVAQAGLAADPDSTVLIRALAAARYHRLQSAGPNAALPADALRTLAMGTEFDAMIAGFERVLDVLPEDKSASGYLLSAYAVSDAPLTDTARKAIGVYEDLYMKASVSRAMDLALVYFKDGKTGRACNYLRFARAGHDAMKPASRKWRTALLGYADARAAGRCESANTIGG